MAEPHPPALVPPDCDLRAFAWLPLPVSFIHSDEWLCASPAGRAAMASLAVASWHQIPASSLPANDRALASLSQSYAKWARIKKEALAGWVECSDGRLYHPVFSEIARNSMTKKQAQINRTEAARLERLAKRRSVTSSVTESRGEEIRGEEIQKENPKEKAGRGGRLSSSGEPPPPPKFL